MTVKELIEQLQEHPEDLEVFVDDGFKVVSIARSEDEAGPYLILC